MTIVICMLYIPQLLYYPLTSLLHYLTTPAISLLLLPHYPNYLTTPATSLIPKPTPCFVLRFALTIIQRSGRAAKTGKAWDNSSCEWHRVDVGGWGPITRKFKHSRAELSTVFRVLTGGEALKPTIANWTMN